MMVGDLVPLPLPLLSSLMNIRREGGDSGCQISTLTVTATYGP